MRTLLTILILIIGLTAYSQEGNLHLIDAVKTKETKENIEKWLIGYWSFREMKSPDGDKIDTLFHKAGDQIIGTEVIERTDYAFNENMTYANNPVLSSTDPVNRDSTQGTWYYDSQKKELILEYHNPIEPDLSGMPESYIKQMKELGMFKPQTSTFLEIHFISEDELVIIEHKAHDENELIYNLLYYIKK
jgi:hypothetical protein